VKLHHALMVGLYSGLILTGAAQTVVTVPVEIGDDGSMIIEGQHYSGPALKAELDRLKERHANLVLSMKQDPEHPLRFEVIGKAIALLQQAGFPKVGFVTEPHALSH
jgi:biopolymer transport protein ExbD